MKHLIKNCLTFLADTVFRLRGLRFPGYVKPRHRIDLLFYGNEQDVANVLKRKLKPGMCILDVGANVGLITRTCAQMVGPDGRVIAFEPDPYTRSFLEHNIRRFSNVTVSPIALSDENTKAKFHLHPESGTSNSLVEFEGNKEIVEVDCMTVDAFLAANRNFKLAGVKIDVEGAELKVLAGMRETIRDLSELFLVIEYCPENLANGGATPEDFYSMLASLGLDVSIIHKNGTTSPIAGLDDLTVRLGKEKYCNLLCQRKS